MKRPARISLLPSWSRPALLAASVGLLFSHLAAAQPLSRDGPEEKTYQVEVIIYSQGGNSRGEGEVWRTDIELDYPLEWRELLSPAQLSGMEEETSAANGAAENAEVIDPTENLGDRALLLLPEEELTLSAEARRLGRSSNRRVLFHGAWRQSMLENRKEPGILIAGGEQFGEHHELEGSINLYLRTYLHIETDLWLSRIATNFGQEHPPWPKLPWPPNRPAEPEDLFIIDDGGSGLWHQFNQNGNAEYEAILSEPYVVENVVLMQQQRRMRSGELHYIDHPRMGLLVKLTPYEPPEEESEAPADSHTVPVDRGI